MARLHISLFGSFQVHLDGQPVTRFESDKVRALLAYLAVEAYPAGTRHGARPHRREHLAGLLWPDQSEQSARHNLSQALLRLRVAIGDRQATPPFLLITPQTIQFNTVSDYWLDVAAFSAQPTGLTTVESLAQAVAHYTGDFLAGFYGVESDLFEEWVLAKRETLQRQVLLLLDRLAQAYEKQGDYDLARQSIHRQLQIDPLQEENHRRLMRLLALSGRRSEALAHYLACHKLLAAELGVEPAPETTALYAAIRTGQPPYQAAAQLDPAHPLSSPSAALPADVPATRIDPGEMPAVALFYGREAEQDELTAWLTTQRCRLVAVVGMGGVGKTSLVAHVVSAVADQFTRVIWRSLLNAPPLAEILRDWLDFLAEQPLSNLPASLDGQIRLLLQQLRQQCVLLILDNVESIMDSGARAGHYRPGYEVYGQLLQRIGESAHQSCLLLTSRERPQEFSRLERGQGAVRVQELTGLAASAGRQILHEGGLIGTADDEAELFERYSGNPLALRLVTETIHELFGGQIAPFLRQERLFFDDMADVLDQQFARLSALEVEIITWLAIEREAIAPQALGQNLVQPRPDHELLTALRALGRRSLLEQRGGAFTLQNVIIEYATSRLIKQVCQELTTLVAQSEVQLQPDRFRASSFNRYALRKAQAKEYIRQSQSRLLLQPIATSLTAQWGEAGLVENFHALRQAMQVATPLIAGYAGGNLLNLLLHLAVDCRGYDFSGLALWQADLQGKQVQEVDFRQADLRDAACTYTLGAPTAVAFSPNGQLLAVATDDCLIWLWQPGSGHALAVLAAHSDYVTSIAFAPDSALLASASGDRTVSLWDVRQPTNQTQPLHSLRGYSYDVLGLAFDPTGTLLATVTADCLRIWPVPGGVEPVFSADLAGRGESVAWSPDGRRLALNVGAEIEVWDAPATLAIRQGQVQQRLEGHTAQIRRLAFSADSQTLVSAGEDQTVRIWRVADGACLWRLTGHTGSVRGLAIDPGGNLVASSGADQRICLWHLQTGERLKTLHGHTQRVVAVAFAPDGQTLVSGGADQTVHFWQVQSGHLLRSIQGITRLVHGVAFSPQGDHYACAVQDGSVRLWSAADHTERRVLQGGQGVVWRVTFSPDGALLASGNHDGTICLWSVATGRLLRQLLAHNKQLSSLAFSPDGRRLASSGYGGTLRLWDVQTATLLHTWPHPTVLASVAFHPGGDLLAVSCYDTRLYLWDVRQGRLLRTLTGHRYEAWGLAFSPDGEWLASSSDDQTVRLWEPNTGMCRHVLAGHTGTVQSLAFHPSGAILASASQDRTIRLWEVSNSTALTASQPWRILAGHQDRVTGLAFSPDGALLLSGSADETLRIWVMADGTCVQTIPMPGPYAGMKIGGVRSLSPAQIANLKALGAEE